MARRAKRAVSGERSATKRRTEIVSERDLRIIRCLQGDPRISIVEIAERVGAPQSTVRNRLARLIGSGAVELMAVTDPLKVGYQVWVMMGLTVELARVTEVANKLCAIPEVYFVALATGEYNLILSASFRSSEDHVEFVTERLPKIPGITHAVTYNLLRIYKRQFSIPPPIAGGRPRGEKR